jgi:hypothetical protein
MVKPLTAFRSRVQRGKPGWQSYCRECERQYKREWREQHPALPHRAYTLTVTVGTRKNPEKTLLAVDIPIAVKRRMIALCQADADLGIKTTVTMLVNEALDEYLELLGFGEQEGAA